MLTSRERQLKVPPARGCMVINLRYLCFSHYRNLERQIMHNTGKKIRSRKF
jgi:hypothetical protein